MEIIGHGVDLIEIAEIRHWLEDPRDPLLQRCFVQEELDEVGDGLNRVSRLAGRFAAKEAVLKALGTGFGGDVAFTDIIVHRAVGEPPQVKLKGGAAIAAAKLGISAWRLSISHTNAMAIASVIAIGDTCHQCCSGSRT